MKHHRHFIIKGEYLVLSPKPLFKTISAEETTSFKRALKTYNQYTNNPPANHMIFITKDCYRSNYHPESAPFYPFYFILYKFPDRPTSTWHPSQPIMKYEDILKIHKKITQSYTEPFTERFVETITCHISPPITPANP
ncbi:hypothetical protein [Bacteroides sp.]|uniref:hypothetical protein n=1 Tax=Bacteroides sp. TaxID=29523 RepID=UPI00262D2B1A|nr:hypothetical protein [Bacteroides sp.]MDD3039086.1 hypothetical protein [Bacteroides sp.]